MKNNDILAIIAAEYIEDYKLRLTFNNGAVRIVDFVPLMQKGICKKLQDKTYFHLSVSVGGKEQVDAMTARLQADGYVIKSGPRTTGDGYYESVIALFDGIELEITI